MSDVVTARTNFLSQVESFAPGQSTRFAPAVDELIRWSEENGLRYVPPTGAKTQIRYAAADRIFWSVVARTGDGAKLTLLNDPGFPGSLRDAARAELAQMDGKAEKEGGVPEVALTKLIWPAYREQALELMARLLGGLGSTPVARTAGAVLQGRTGATVRQTEG